MKDLLLTFEDFITGIGIWILVGCLAFCLVVSVIFLVLNLQKEKKEKENENRQFAESIAMVQKQEAENKVVEETTEKKEPAKKKAVKKTVAKQVEKVEEKPAEEKPAEEKPAEKKASQNKPAAKKTSTKKVEEKSQTVEAPVNYEVLYDANAKEWVVKKENSTRATKRTQTKQQAIDYAKPLADKNGTKLIIHNKN